MMRVLRRKIVALVVAAYVAFSLYAAYNVFFSKRIMSRVHRVVKKVSAGRFHIMQTQAANVSLLTNVGL